MWKGEIWAFILSNRWKGLRSSFLREKCERIAHWENISILWVQIFRMKLFSHQFSKFLLFKSSFNFSYNFYRDYLTKTITAGWPYIVPQSTGTSVIFKFSTADWYLLFNFDFDLSSNVIWMKIFSEVLHCAPNHHFGIIEMTSMLLDLWYHGKYSSWFYKSEQPYILIW